MADFIPFDDEYGFDKSVLTEQFPDYLMPSVKDWLFKTLRTHKHFTGVIGRGQVTDTFIHPISREFHMTFHSNDTFFFDQISSNVKLFRNVLSYILQKVASPDDAKNLEKILHEGSSAYAVELSAPKTLKTPVAPGINAITTLVQKRLVYRVAPVVKKQAAEITVFFKKHGTHIMASCRMMKGQSLVLLMLFQVY